MYNRYIPQPDGTYQRSRMEDHLPHSDPAAVNEPEAVPSPVKPHSTSPGTSQVSASHPSHTARNHRRTDYVSHPSVPRESSSGNILNFFHQLMPQGFDTEDLIIVLLLLLLSGDSGGEQNTALLTLVIYLFL